MVKRIVVGAHYGLRDWLMQRVTAVIMVLATLVFAAFFVTHLSMEFEDWQGFLSFQAIRVLTLLFFLSLFLHAWVGIRDILMDYVQPVGIRLTLQIATIIALVSYALWTVSILWRV
jgi:succinate dehydrogenase / fumarate reductase membrane anchor subunit